MTHYAFKHILATVLLLGSLASNGLCSDAATDQRLLNGDHWKITFPVQGPTGNALEIKNPEFSAALKDPSTLSQDLQHYFYRSEEGQVFVAEYTGVTTSSKTKYSRTELREMTGPDQHNWKIGHGSQLNCKLKISSLEGGANKLFFMQIHGNAPASQPLIKCIWEKGKIRLLTKSGEKLKDYKKQQSYTEIPVDQWFTCTIDINPERLSVSINGEVIETYTREEVLQYWPAENTYYFKAGNYLQNNTPGAKSTVIFESIEISHDAKP